MSDFGLQSFAASRREIAIAGKILEAYKNRTGIFEGYYSEAKNDIGLERGLYLNYITLTNVIDYEKYMDPNKLWKASKEWVKTCPWLFEPKQLFNKRVGVAVEVFRQIGQQYSGIFRPKDIGVWLPAAEALLRHGGDTITLLRSYRLDASEIFKAITTMSKTEFPIVSGSKTLPRWLRILWDDAEVPLKRMESVPLPVDRSTAQATYKLIFRKQLKGFLDKRKKNEIELFWKQVAERLGVPLISFDAPLRFLGLSQKKLDLAVDLLGVA